MLKITPHDTPTECRFKLEGRLAGPWVQELQQCWNSAGSETDGRKIVVDLADVDFVDHAGEALLMSMHSSGVELVGETPLICSMLKELCRAVRCARVKGRAGSS